MTDKEYCALFKMFAVTTGDEVEDNRLMNESFDEDFADYLHDEDKDGDLI